MDDYESENGHSHPSSDITFLVHYGEHTIRLEMTESDTVGDIKRLLTKKTGLKGDDLDIVGWEHPEAISDEVAFVDIGIPREYHLGLFAKSGSADERQSKTYHLQINDIANDETYSLYVNGAQTVQQVKEHVAQLSAIPLERQGWDGWPWPCSDDDMLYGIGLRTPNHDLTLRFIHPTANHNGHGNLNRSASEARSQSSTENYDDDMDDSDIVEFAPRAPQRGSLVPDSNMPMFEAIQTFVQNFETRYGEDHPPFYIGTLRQAMSHAFDLPLGNRRLLVVYIHNDRSIAVNIFVSQVLQGPLIRDYLTEHSVIWPYDVTLPESRRVLRDELEILDQLSAMHLLHANVEKFPMLFICAKRKNGVELVQRLNGSQSPQEVLDALMRAGELNRMWQDEEIREQELWRVRQSVVAEQDDAYKASLAEDIRKQKAKQAEREKLLEAEQQEAERLRRREEERKEADRTLPPEPQQSNGDNITVIRLRTPDGKSLTRRFLSSDPLQHLFTFAHAKGYPVDEFNLAYDFPRKQLTGLDPEKSFRDLGLTQQVAVFVEEH